MIAQSTAFDPAAMEEKVSENMDEIKDIIAETGEEAKMLTKFTLPVLEYACLLHFNVCCYVSFFRGRWYMVTRALTRRRTRQDKPADVEVDNPGAV